MSSVSIVISFYFGGFDILFESFLREYNSELEISLVIRESDGVVRGGWQLLIGSICRKFI